MAHASWNNVTTDPAMLTQIQTALSVEELPPVGELTDAQLQIIRQSVGDDIANKVKTQMQEVENPSLQEPDLDFGDGSALVLLLMELNGKLGDLQIGTAKEGVKHSKEKLAAKSEARLEKIIESIDKLKEAAKSATASKVLGWIGAIAGLVAAVAATILTGGALAGVALTLAVIGVGMMIAQETGGMDALMQEMFGDDEKAKMIFQIALTVTLLVASIACGAGMAKAASSVANITKMCSGIASLTKASTDAVQSAARVAMIGSALVGALTGIAGGSVGIDAAVKQKDANEAQAQVKEFEAWLAKLNSQLEQQQEELREAIEKLQQGAVQIPSDLLDTIRESFSNILSDDPV